MKLDLAFALALGVGAWGLAAPAQAGLVGVGRTVQVIFYLGNTSIAEAQIDSATSSTTGSLASGPVSFLQGPQSGSTVLVSDLQIDIKNLLSNTPYCSTANNGTSCADALTGFDILFTGENILSVSVDPSSAPGMLPVLGNFQGNPHLGLQLISPNQIRVDLTGDLPNVNDNLVLDLSFDSGPAPTVPEPGSVALFGLALFGLVVMRRPRRQAPTPG